MGTFTFGTSSVLKVGLKPTMHFPVKRYHSTWLFVLSYLENVKTSKGQSAVSSKAKSFLESVLFKSERCKLIIEAPIVCIQIFTGYAAMTAASNIPF